MCLGPGLTAWGFLFYISGMETLELYLNRKDKTEVSTIGSLEEAGKRICYILEDKDRFLKQTDPLEHIEKTKVYGETAIPAGRYKVIISYSKRFKKELPEILNVPGFTGIRIHSGNKAIDSLGCLITGLGKGVNVVSDSRNAMLKLMPLLRAALKKGEVYITIQ